MKMSTSAQRLKHIVKNRLNLQYLLLIILITACSTGFLPAQDMKVELTSAEKTQVIDSLAKNMKDKYVFEDIGAKISKFLENNLKKGLYNKITSPIDFAEQLTKDIRSFNDDKHLRVTYNPKQIKQNALAAQDDKDAQKAIERMQRMDNYGFKEIKIMPGNIGYLKFNGFNGTEEGFKTAIGAMAFVSHCDALIFDIRDNGGGDPAMVQLLLSYLYNEGEEVHFNDFFVRKGNNTQQYWAMPYCPGTRMPDLDVYVLTSKYTFSCAEEFAYDLKNLERGTIVGDITGGGAHPVSSYNLNENFTSIIPFGRAINPISKTNWEGTGVQPDVVISSAEALDKAYQLALEKRMAKETDEKYKAYYQWAIDGLKAKSNPAVLSEELMKTYAGVYGVRTITYEKGELYYQREGRDKFRMIPITDNYFWFKEVDYFRLKVIVQDGKAVKLEGHYEDGRVDFNDRMK